MNVERITELRNFLAALPEEKFDMRDFSYRDECGSPACIGGWAKRLFNIKYTGLHQTNAAVGEILGLNATQYEDLFMPGEPYMFHYNLVTRDHAVTTLDKLVETGGVDWSHVKTPAR